MSVPSVLVCTSKPKYASGHNLRTTVKQRNAGCWTHTSILYKLLASTGHEVHALITEVCCTSANHELHMRKLQQMTIDIYTT